MPHGVGHYHRRQTLYNVHQWPKCGDTKEVNKPTGARKDFHKPAIHGEHCFPKDHIQLSQAQLCLATNAHGQGSLLQFYLWSPQAWSSWTQESCEIPTLTMTLSIR